MSDFYLICSFIADSSNQTSRSDKNYYSLCYPHIKPKYMLLAYILVSFTFKLHNIHQKDTVTFKIQHIVPY